MMYHRAASRLLRPGLAGLTRIQTRGARMPRNPELITKVTEEYEREADNFGKDSKLDRDERRKKMIKFLYYKPTVKERLLLIKARFFATGWIYVVTAVLCVVAFNFTKAYERFSNRDKYGI